MKDYRRDPRSEEKPERQPWINREKETKEKVVRL